MNIRDAEDTYLQSKAEVDEFISELEREWIKPQIMTQLGLMAGAMGQEQLDMLDEGTKQVLSEVFNA